MLISVQYSSHEEQTRHAAEFLSRQGYTVEPPDSDRLAGRTEEPRRRKRAEPQEQAATTATTPTAPAANSQRRPAQASTRKAKANQPGSPSHEMSALDEKKVKVSSESPSPKPGHSTETTVPKRGRKPKLDDSGPVTYAEQRQIHAELTASATAKKRKTG